ncbi:hypothetical protein [Niveibacterium sp.]|uniref:hypothetical protein n=1 Tax=Niveibacterium sp. TaxID=2017444 RepID=UPI0035B194AD
MLHTVFFLIEPNKEALREFPVRAGGEFAQVLLDPLLTSRDYADRSNWREDEAELAVKLLYVARLREYAPLTDDKAARQLLGSEHVSTEIFDRWWSIRRLSLEEGKSEEMHDYLGAVTEKVKPTGNSVVDEWVRRLSNEHAA